MKREFNSFFTYFLLKNDTIAFMKIISNSLKETEKLAQDFINRLGNLVSKSEAFVVGLYGDLGSGKTTFVKFVAKEFGLKNTVTSPTFVIEKIYPVRTDGRKRPTSNPVRDKSLNGTNGTGPLKHDFDNLIHIDAYRLESADELKALGWEEISKNPKNIIFIEWPENVKSVLSKNIKEIHFKFIDENTREIVW